MPLSWLLSLSMIMLLSAVPAEAGSDNTAQGAPPPTLGRSLDKAVPATAAAAVPSPLHAQSKAPASGDDNISNAQSVMIRFSTYPELNGEYRVNPDRTVSIPAIGRVSVAGLDAVKMEQLLSDKATDLSGHQVFVTVEVAEYRPVYVTGQVSKPGAIQWQPGMTVLQAIGAAGGIARRRSDGSGDGLDMARLKVKIDQQTTMLARQARLLAEQQDTGNVAVPKQLTALVGSAGAKALIDAQQKILTAHRTAFRNQLRLSSVGKSLANQELDGLKMQKQRIDEQLRLRQQQRDRIRTLLSKGLTVADRSLEENIKVSELEEKEANIAVAIARVQATIAGYDRDSFNLRQKQQTDLETELARLKQEIAENKIDIDAARDQARLFSDKRATEAREDHLGPSYMIQRIKAGAAVSTGADETTAVHPGDVVQVAPVDLDLLTASGRS